MTDHLVHCACCGDSVPESTTYVDPDLKAPVCTECKINLRWAQARLKEAGIITPPRD